MTLLRKIMELRVKAEGYAGSVPELILESHKYLDSVLHGMHSIRKSGAGDNFWQYRDYQVSDRPQDIDWRQSAKTDDVFVSQKEWHVARKTLFWCSGDKSMRFSSQKISKLYTAQIYCMTIALLLSREGERVGFLGQHHAGQNEQALNALGYHLIACEKANNGLSSVSSDAVSKGANLILCGDFLSPIDDIEAALLPLLARCGSCVMIQILDPAEVDLGFEGRIKFRDSDYKNSIEIDHVGSVRDAYKARLQEHLERLSQWCLRHNVTYIRHITDEDISAKIVELNTIGRAA